MVVPSFVDFVIPFAPFLVKKSRYYSETREDFYEARNVLSNIEGFQRLLQPVSQGTCKTQTVIRCYGLSFGVSLKESMASLGKPNFISKKSSFLPDHQILFYKVRISQVKCILQLHFFQDQFFLGVIELRSDRKDFKNRVTDILRKKYSIPKNTWTGTLSDPYENTIEMKANMVPHIVYRFGDKRLNQQLRLQLADNTALLRKQADRELDFLLDVV